MAQNIIETWLIPFPIQKGNGTPTHISPDGTIYFDRDSGLCYQNIDGMVSWNLLGGGGGGTFSGGTVTGPTNFLAGLTTTTVNANSVSATTYYNLPKDIYVTGGTKNNSIVTFTNNTGGTFNVSGFTTQNDVYVTGGTYSNGTAVFTNNTGGTFNVSGFAENLWEIGSAGVYSLKAINDSSLDATGDYSTASGYQTLASGLYSFAEGYQTIASGQSSHASGINSVANGLGSFVHGSASTANGVNTIVLGANITGTTNNTVYVPYLNIGIVPSGTSVNSLGVDSSGNVIIGDTSTTSQTVWISTTDSVEVSGTTGVTLMKSQLIPANTFQTGDAIRIRSRILKTNTNAVYNSSIYVNTASTITGAVILATYATTAFASRFTQIKRDFVIKSSANTESLFVTTSALTDDFFTSQAVSSTNINWTVDQYIIFAVNPNSILDRFTHTYYIIEKL